MGYVLLGILVLGLVATIVAAVMNSKTEPQAWPIYQAILLVFVFIAAGAFFWLGAQTLSIHKKWRDSYQQNQQQAEMLEGQLLPLVGGMGPDGRGVSGEIPALKSELSLAVDARLGGVYYGVKAQGAENGVVTLTLSPQGVKPAAEGAEGAEGVPPEPVAEPAAPPADGQAAAAPAGTGHGLVPDTVLFAFDEKSAAEGGRYLGEFKVTEATADSPTFKVTPNFPLTQSQAARMEEAATGTWTLYTVMPVDSTAVFAGMDDAKRQALLPAESVELYAQADRPLRDYYGFFHENYVQRVQIADAISKLTSNIERMEAATAEVEKEAGYRQGEKDNLQADLKGFEGETEAIAGYEQSLEKLLAAVQNQRKETYLENRRAAQTLTREQLKSAREIDQRTATGG